MINEIELYGDGIGKVQYIDHMGTDLTIVNSARVSFGVILPFAEIYPVSLCSFFPLAFGLEQKSSHSTSNALPVIFLEELFNCSSTFFILSRQTKSFNFGI